MNTLKNSFKSKKADDQQRLIEKEKKEKPVKMKENKYENKDWSFKSSKDIPYNKIKDSTTASKSISLNVHSPKKK